VGAGNSVGADARTYHAAATVNGAKLAPGAVVLLDPQEGPPAADAASGCEQHAHYVLGLVQCMWEDDEGEMLAQVRCERVRTQRVACLNGCAG
jgi:hypothetical protein